MQMAAYSMHYNLPNGVHVVGGGSSTVGGGGAQTTAPPPGALQSGLVVTGPGASMASNSNSGSGLAITPVMPSKIIQQNVQLQQQQTISSFQQIQVIPLVDPNGIAPQSQQQQQQETPQPSTSSTNNSTQHQPQPQKPKLSSTFKDWKDSDLDELDEEDSELEGLDSEGGRLISAKIADEDLPEVDIVIQNVVSSFSVRCHLNLREIALKGKNVEYKRENGMVTMKLRRPYTTASIWSSGKITCTGANSEEHAKTAARRYARVLQKLGFAKVQFRQFRIVNVLGTVSMPFAIKIDSFSQKYKEASYEPEIHPGVTFKMKNPKATLKIFSTGSVTVTAPSVRNVQLAVEHIFPLIEEFKKPKQASNKTNKELQLANKAKRQQKQLMQQQLQQSRQSSMPKRSIPSGPSPAAASTYNNHFNNSNSSKKQEPAAKRARLYDGNESDPSDDSDDY